MKITKWGEYGILCCMYLAEHHGQKAVGAGEISETQSIPLQYTHQILQRLRKGGIIESLRGPHGGYRLAKSPENTNLKDIIYATEGNTFGVICDIHPPYARCTKPEERCGLYKVWHELKDAIDTLLAGRTLAGVLNGRRSPA